MRQHLLNSFTILIFCILINHVSTFAQTGSPDLNFGDSGQAILKEKSPIYFSAIALQQNGKIITTGSGYNLVTARYNANGSLDSSFGTNGVVQQSFGYYTSGHAVAIQSDGKIVVAGSIESSDLDTSRCLVVRYLRNGKPDNTFGDNGSVIIAYKNGFYSGFVKMILQADDKIVCAGFGNGKKTENFIIYRFNTNGTIDSSFGNNGITSITFPQPAYLTDLMQQPDGKLIAVGSSNISNVLYIARCTKNGKLDKLFGDNGKVINEDTLTRLPFLITMQSNGRLIISGVYKSTKTILKAYLNDGIVDSSFGINGAVLLNSITAQTHELCIESDDKIIGAGYINYHFGMYRVLQNGTIDESFGDNGVVTRQTTSATANDVKLDSRNRILLCGSNGKNGLLCRFKNNIMPFAISSANSVQQNVATKKPIQFIEATY